jgi:hypothetical protein
MILIRLFQKIKECSFVNDEIFKSMVNTLAGMVGKTHNKHTHRVRFCQANDNSKQHMMYHIHQYDEPFLSTEYDDEQNEYLVEIHMKTQITTQSSGLDSNFRSFEY